MDSRGLGKCYGATSNSSNHVSGLVFTYFSLVGANGLGVDVILAHKDDSHIAKALVASF